jgi:hypothetical protein
MTKTPSDDMEHDLSGTETSHPYNPSNLSMEPVDISHIRKEQPRLSAKIPWVFALTEEIDSYMPCDEQVNLSLDPDSIYFQSDSKRKSPRNPDPEKRKKEAPAGRRFKSTCSLQTLFLLSSFSLALALLHSSSSIPDSPRTASRRGGAGGGGIQDSLLGWEAGPHVRLGTQDGEARAPSHKESSWARGTHPEGESLSEARRHVRSRAGRAGLAWRERGS